MPSAKKKNNTSDYFNCVLCTPTHACPSEATLLFIIDKLFEDRISCENGAFAVIVIVVGLAAEADADAHADFYA